jgi:hypothetical protein
MRRYELPIDTPLPIGDRGEQLGRVPWQVEAQ